jgi:geranylgeranyl pyrophosphate synthase
MNIERRNFIIGVGAIGAGAILAGGDAAARRQLRAYGRAIGLSFQIADDILDVVGDKKKLGKKGSDAANQKLTYVSLYGLGRARREAAALTRRAHRALRPFGRKAAVLHELADYIVTRDR